MSEVLQTPPPGSIPRDWIADSCVILSGYNQDPPPPRVVHGEPSDPPNLWTGACGPVAVTLRDRTTTFDLSGLARMRSVTRVSDFHVVRPVLRLADDTFLIGGHPTGADRPGAGADASTDFLESELSFGTVRWLRLDATAWSRAAPGWRSRIWVVWTRSGRRPADGLRTRMRQVRQRRPH